MKKIPCPTCRTTAVGQHTSVYPEGAPMVFGRFTGGDRALVLKCQRCKTPFKLDAVAFNLLPDEMVGTPPAEER